MRTFKRMGLGVMLALSHVCASDQLRIEDWLKELKEAKMETRSKMELVNKCQIANFRLDDTPEYNAIFWMLEYAKHSYSLELLKEVRRVEFFRTYHRNIK